MKVLSNTVAVAFLSPRDEAWKRMAARKVLEDEDAIEQMLDYYERVITGLEDPPETALKWGFNAQTPMRVSLWKIRRGNVTYDLDTGTGKREVRTLTVLRGPETMAERKEMMGLTV